MFQAFQPHVKWAQNTECICCPSRPGWNAWNNFGVPLLKADKCGKMRGHWKARRPFGVSRRTSRGQATDALLGSLPGETGDFSIRRIIPPTKEVFVDSNEPERRRGCRTIPGTMKIGNSAALRPFRKIVGTGLRHFPGQKVNAAKGKIAAGPDRKKA